MAARALRLSHTLPLPIEFATEGVAVIGMRGSGKSNTEARFAEVLYDAGIPFVVVDPKGDWHGIRSSADGKTAGLSVPVFGGLHGDFPLEPSMGARIADLLVDENLSAVLDISSMSKTGGLPQFLTAFCNQLMHRHRLDPQVRTVILEEAHRYIPQEVRGPTAALKEAAASLLLEGRAFGLGCWAATQRPARLHKDVLEEVGTAIIHRIGVSATNDKRTIAGWVKHYDLSTEIVDSLTSLAPGEAWVLMPEKDLVRRVQIERRHTFDSAATPTVGARARRPNTMADIDAGAIKEALDDVIERAKADDPKTMRKRIADLEHDLAKARKDQAEHPRTVEKLVEIPTAVVPMETRKHAAFARDRLAGAADAIVKALDSVDALIATFTDVDTDLPKKKAIPMRPIMQPAIPASNVDRGKVPLDDRSGAVGKSAFKLLVILAQHPDGLTRARLAALAGMSLRKSTLRNALSELRKHDLINPGSGDPVMATDVGIALAADHVVDLPTGEELREYWINKIGRLAVPGRILAVLIESWPYEMTPRETAGKVGVDPTTSTMRNAMSKLRTYGLLGRGFILNADVAEAMGLPGAL